MKAKEFIQEKINEANEDIALGRQKQVSGDLMMVMMTIVATLEEVLSYFESGEIDEV